MVEQLMRGCMLKIKTFGIFIIFFLIPVLSGADYTLPVVIQGTIGDFSKQSRNYEIDGKIYHFPQNIVLENRHGNRISFDHIKPGSAVKVIGEKNIGAFNTVDNVKNRLEGSAAFSKVAIAGAKAAADGKGVQFSLDLSHSSGSGEAS